MIPPIVVTAGATCWTTCCSCLTAPCQGFFRRHVGYVIHCRSNIDKLKVRAEELDATKETIVVKVAQAERRGEIVEHNVEFWVKSVGEIVDEAKEIYKEQSLAKLCFYGICPNIKVYHQLGKKSKKLTVEVEHKLQMVPNNVSSGNMQAEVWAVSVGDYKAFQSRERIFKDVMESLKDRNVHRVGVFGVGGVGKTSFIKEIFRLAANDTALFDDVVILLDVKNYRPEDIQNIILQKLGVDTEKGSQIKAERLCGRLQGRKTLVILDDVQEVIDLVDMGLPRFKDCNSDCKILITCRNGDLLAMDKMGVDVKRSLDLLDEEETWQLFKDMVGPVLSVNDDIEKLGKQLAEKFGGLPLLVRTVASVLKGKNRTSFWRDALRQLERFERAEITEKAYLAIEWCYDQLDNMLKQLLVLCGILVRGNHVNMQDLLFYGMGLGWFIDTKTVEQARDKLENLIDKLTEFCLLEVEIKTWGWMLSDVKIHDIVCHVLKQIACKERALSIVYEGDMKEWPYQNLLRNCTKFKFLQQDAETSPAVPRECPELELLILHDFGGSFLQFPPNLFSKMQKLKVLEFCNANLTELPRSMMRLKLLQTLCVHWCTLEDVSLFGSLSSLEVLSLVGSEFAVLPEEIGNLVRLRVLDLSSCRQLRRIYPTVLSKLVALEMLRMGEFDKWVSEDGNGNPRLSELKSLSRLSTLEIEIPDANMLPTDLFTQKLKRFIINVGKFLTSVKIKHEDDRNPSTTTLSLVLTKQFDRSLIPLIKKSEMLSLGEKEVDIIQCLDTEDLNNVKHLTLQSSKMGFPILVTKKVEFPNLTTLRVELCEFDVLFSISMARSLVSLRALEISSCHRLQGIVSEEDEGGLELTPQYHRFVFPNVRYVLLDDLPMLTSFYGKKHTSEWPSLKKLSVKGCNKLKITTEVSHLGKKHEMETSEKSLFLIDEACVYNAENCHGDGLTGGSGGITKAMR